MNAQLSTLAKITVGLGAFLMQAQAMAAPAWEALELKTESGYEASPSEIEASLSDDQIEVPYSTDAAFETAAHGKVQVLTFRKPVDFPYEFSLLIVNGKIRRTFLVSTAVAGKIPILGIHKLTPLKVKGLPWPWIRSQKFENSPMYWGLNIRGGFFIHSSPHYGKLGAPASMGCIRASIPDAMEVFNTVANEFADLPSYSMIYEGFTFATETPQKNFLNAVLKNSEMTVDQLKDAIETDRSEILAVSKGDLYYAKGVPVDAHARPFTGQQSDLSLFPRCGGEDCWKVFGKAPKILSLSPEALVFTSIKTN